MFEAVKIFRVNNLFFKCLFSLLNFPSSSKLERILTLMIKRAKGIEIDEINFYNTFENIWFKKHSIHLENYECIIYI
jgi:hypothetical protein